MNRWMVVWIEEGWIVRWMNERIDGWTDEWMDWIVWIDDRMDEWTKKWLNGTMNGWKDR